MSLTQIRTESSFVFYNKLYKQIHRVNWVHLWVSQWLMLFFVITKIFGLMNALLNLNLQFTEIMLTTFFLLKSGKHLKVFVIYANSKHKTRKFTFTDKHLNNFSFSNVKITSKNKWFLISYFRKATFREVSTDYDIYKILIKPNVLFFSYLQGFKICFSMENFQIVIEQLRSIFKYISYPVNIVDQCIEQFSDKLYVAKQIVSTVPEKELLIVLPFLGKFSINLRIRLYISVSQTLPQCKIKVIFRSKNRLSNLFKFKDSLPLNVRSNLIYKIQFSNCKIT